MARSRTRSAEVPFDGVDTWVFHSLFLSAGPKGASIREILGAGDYLNHAIFTAGELRSGLSKLMNAGYVARVGLNWRLKGKAVTFARKKLSSVSTRKVRRAIEDFLDAVPHQSGEPLKNVSERSFPALTDSDFRKALREYKR